MPCNCRAGLFLGRCTKCGAEAVAMAAPSACTPIKPPEIGVNHTSLSPQSQELPAQSQEIVDQGLDSARINELAGRSDEASPASLTTVQIAALLAAGCDDPESCVGRCLVERIAELTADLDAARRAGIDLAALYAGKRDYWRQRAWDAEALTRKPTPSPIELMPISTWFWLQLGRPLPAGPVPGGAVVDG